MNDSALVIRGLQDGVLTLTLNRPDSLNALNAALVIELKAALEEASRDADVGVFSGGFASRHPYDLICDRIGLNFSWIIRLRNFQIVRFRLTCRASATAGTRRRAKKD